MPFGRSSQPKPAPADARDWRPQSPGTRSFRSILDPVVEPFWDGIHVLAHVAYGVAELLDEQGGDWRDELPDLAARIAQATHADDAIVDGFLTPQMTEAQPGAELPKPIGPQDMLRQYVVGDRRSNRVPLPPRIVPGTQLRFVAVDLLSIDGSRLLDVPLLERKRLLEGALTPVEGVSVTPYVRPPVDAFIVSCRAVGFWAIVYKNANSRYVPGSRNDDWAVYRIPAR